jgi:hypothetical protein
MRYTFFIPIAGVLFLYAGITACKSPGKKDTHRSPSAQHDEHVQSSEKDTLNISFDQNRFPSMDGYRTKILTPGLFHNDEVWENAEETQWYGLFNEGDIYYLAKTDIKCRKANDPVLDAENERTGWDISVIHDDTCMILIESLPYLSEKSIEPVKGLKEYIYPYDTVTFSYLGIRYKLFATGGKKQAEGSDWFTVWNYKLYLAAEINGIERTTLLVQQPAFEDAMTTLMFAGDIDGDNILDLILDTSHHYNMMLPTVYLSKPAEKGRIVIPVGAHPSVGC